MSDDNIFDFCGRQHAKDYGMLHTANSDRSRIVGIGSIFGRVKQCEEFFLVRERAGL